MRYIRLPVEDKIVLVLVNVYGAINLTYFQIGKQ